jgi:hypothetical protein
MVPGPKIRSQCVGPAFGDLHIAKAMYCTHLSLGTKWILRDEPADTRGHSGIHLEWVKETSMYRIHCECMMAYIGQTGCCIKTSTTDSSILNESAVVEHSINILLKDKGVLTRKKQPRLTASGNSTVQYNTIQHTFTYKRYAEQHNNFVWKGSWDSKPE